MTRVKAVHITELRAAIALLRAPYLLPAVAWTDSTLVPGVTVVKASHIAQLRTAVAEVYEAAGRTVPAWHPGSLVAGSTPLAAAHLAEIGQPCWRSGSPAATPGRAAGGCGASARYNRQSR